MNSLPLIHHHLFVAAIGNEDRVCPKPSQPQERSVELVGPAKALAFELLESRSQAPAGITRAFQESVDATSA